MVRYSFLALFSCLENCDKIRSWKSHGIGVLQESVNVKPDQSVTSDQSVT